jgi:hypothetical protein
MVGKYLSFIDDVPTTRPPCISSTTGEYSSTGWFLVVDLTSLSTK